MLEKFMSNFRNPQGVMGWLLAGMMNAGHGPMTAEVVRGLDLKVTDTVLDIGCGGGGAIARMAEKAASVYGIDYSPQSVRKARSVNKAAIKAGRVRIDCCSVDDMKFAEPMFDTITTFESLYFWPNPERNFAHILSLLQPGGKFIIALEAYRKGGATINLPKIFEKVPTRLYSAEELFGMLEAAGFNECWQMPVKGKFLCVQAAKATAKAA